MILVAISALLMIELPPMNVDCSFDAHLWITSHNLLAKALARILYKMLHKVIGLKSLIGVGFSNLGTKTLLVLFTD